jgi:hypothetical protein
MGFGVGFGKFAISPIPARPNRRNLIFLHDFREKSVKL